MRVLSGLAVLAFVSVVAAGPPEGRVDPPEVKELSPVPAPPPVKASDPIPVEIAKYRIYSIVGYTGEVTWQIVGKSVGTKEADKPLTLFGVISGQTDPGEYPVPAGALIVWGKEQGLTAVAAWGVVNGRAKQLAALSFIVGPAPPVPNPNPPPVGKMYGWIMLEESSQAWATRGQAVAEAVKWSEANGIKHRIFDVSNPPPADVAPYVTRAAGKPLPYLYIVTETGVVLYEGTVPKTATGLPDKIKEYK